MRLEPVLRNKRSHHNEKPMHCNEPQLEKARTQQQRPNAAKNKIKSFKKNRIMFPVHYVDIIISLIM